MADVQISEAAQRCGVAPSTLRYERIGLVAPRRSHGGYRVYGAEELSRLAFVVAIKRLGVPLERVRVLVAAREDQPCRSVRARLRTELQDEAAATALRIAELKALQASLLEAIEDLDELPDGGARCVATCALLAA